MASFEGKVIAITGGASGIGLATAEILAARGATLSISDRNQDTLDEAVKAVTKISNGRKHSGTVLDVRDSQAVTGWINKTVSEFGKLDGAANMAGTILEDHTIKEETDEQWKLIMDINASGVFYSLRAELNVMKDGGSIVCATSVSGQKGVPGEGAYVASKHAVIGLSKTAARENPGIRVNAISPGATATPLVNARAKARGHMQPITAACINRLADPVEIAQGIVWLLSDDASYVTGHVLNVDGGWLA